MISNSPVAGREQLMAARPPARVREARRFDYALSEAPSEIAHVPVFWHYFSYFEYAEYTVRIHIRIHKREASTRTLT